MLCNHQQHSVRAAGGCNLTRPFSVASLASTCSMLHVLAGTPAVGHRHPAPVATASLHRIPCTAERIRSTDVLAQAAADGSPGQQQMSALQSRTSRQTEQWQQQQQQQQQQMPKQQQQQWRWSRQGPLPPPLSHKPYVVRIAGRTSSIQGAAGAITKRLRTDDLIRVTAIDSGSIAKAAVALSVADIMMGANTNQMLVFQPMLVTNDDDAPKVPKGSMVMYTSRLWKGEILTDNWMPVKAGTNSKQLSGAIAARIRQSGHTVLECYGSAAVTTAIQALALARQLLRAGQQDVACLVASGRKMLDSSGNTAAAADGSNATATMGVARSSSGSKYPSTCHRLIVLECERSKPTRLLVRQTQGMTDRAQHPTLADPAANAAAVKAPAVDTQGQ